MAAATEEELDLTFSQQRFEDMQRHEVVMNNETAAPAEKIDAMIEIIRIHRYNGCLIQAEEIAMRAVRFGHEHGFTEDQFASLDYEVSALKRRGQRTHVRLFSGCINRAAAKAGFVFSSLDVDREAESLNTWRSVWQPPPDFTP